MAGGALCVPAKKQRLFTSTPHNLPHTSKLRKKNAQK
jgi:hypothetical protein